MICPEYTSCCGVTSCSAQRSWELIGITYWERSGVNAATPWAPPRSAEAPPASLVLDESRHSTGPGGARCWLTPWWRDGHDSRTPRRVDTGYHDEEEEGEEDVGVLSWSWGTSEDQKDKKSSTLFKKLKLTPVSRQETKSLFHQTWNIKCHSALCLTLSSPSSPKTLIISIIWPPSRHLPLVINMYLCVNAAP